MPKSTKLKRIASWNVNGIRACSKSGLADWLTLHDADVILLQEVRAEQHQIPEDISCLGNYRKHWFPAAVKKGYSGTGILAKEAPIKVHSGLGHDEFDGEGRVITAEFKDLIAVSAYFPNSQAEGARIAYKLRFCAAMEEWLDKQSRKGKPVVLGGDFNVAPNPVDLARPKDNEGNPGYLPGERAWMNSFLNAGWIDTWRHLHPDEVKYSWWSTRMGARAKNIGWRIDFHVVAKAHMDRIAGSDMLIQVSGSDHCPVTLDLLVD